MADVQISTLGGVIKTAYEGETDTNAFTDAEKAKLTGIEAAATADQSDAEIETAYGNRVPAASQAEAEAGSEIAVRRWSPLRIAQAVAALAPVGGGGPQNNFAAAADPGTGDDAGAGYAAGSVWINTATSEAWRCISATAGAAVWVKTTLTADELAPVALSGSYADLANRPTLGALAAKATIDAAGLVADAVLTRAKLAPAALLGTGAKLVTADAAGTDGQLAAFDAAGSLVGGPTPATASGIAAKAAPVANDRWLIFDSEASYGFRYVAHSVLQTLALAWVAAAKYLKSDPAGVTGAAQVTNVISLTTAQYAAIGTPGASTLYLITDAS